MKKAISVALAVMVWMSMSAFTFRDAVDQIVKVRKAILAPVHDVIDYSLETADSSTAKAGSLINDTASATKRYVLDITARIL